MHLGLLCERFICLLRLRFCSVIYLVVLGCFRRSCGVLCAQDWKNHVLIWLLLYISTSLLFVGFKKCYRQAYEQTWNERYCYVRNHLITSPICPSTPILFLLTFNPYLFMVSSSFPSLSSSLHIYNAFETSTTLEYPCRRRSHSGAWIESPWDDYSRNLLEVAPIRERGLKDAISFFRVFAF